MVTPEPPSLPLERADFLGFNHANPTAAQEAPSRREVDTQRCASDSLFTPTAPECFSVESNSDPIFSSDRSDRSDSITDPLSIQRDSSGTEFSKSTGIDNLELYIQSLLKVKESEIERCHEYMAKMLSIINRVVIRDTNDKEIAIYRDHCAEMMEVFRLMATNTMFQEKNRYDLRGAKFGGGFANRDQYDGILNDYSTNHKLTEAAAEIQQLLEQLSRDNPTTTKTEELMVVTKAVEQIERNQSLKSRVVSALKSGGTEALKEAVDHPLVNILMATIGGWYQIE